MRSRCVAVLIGLAACAALPAASAYAGVLEGTGFQFGAPFQTPCTSPTSGGTATFAPSGTNYLGTQGLVPANFTSRVTVLPGGAVPAVLYEVSGTFSMTQPDGTTISGTYGTAPDPGIIMQWNADTGDVDAVCDATQFYFAAQSLYTATITQPDGTSATDHGEIYVAQLPRRGGGGSSVNVSFTSWCQDPSYSALCAAYTPPPPPLPTDKAQCLNDGWKGYSGFKNLGDCVSYVASNGKNKPAAG